MESPTRPLVDQFQLNSQADFQTYLKALINQDTNGANLHPQDISTSKSLLFYYYGYPMGSLQSDPSSDVTVKEQLASNMDEKMTPNLASALSSFARSSNEDLQDRYNFYSNIQVKYAEDGTVTNGRSILLSQGERSITMSWSTDFANLASKVGVSADDALRKTSFSVYQAAIDASFTTDDIQSFVINGAWRPSAEDYRAINGNRLPAGFKTWWSSAHVTSNAIDINLVNGIAVDGGSYRSGKAGIVEPEVISNFIDNLASEPNSRQLFSPWQMNTNITDPFVFSTNKGVTANERIHANHIHFGTNGE